MSVCNYTQLVSPNTCLGDSLATFNANFSALDEGLCDIPDVLPGVGIVTDFEVSEQNNSAIRVSTKNSFVYDVNFDYKTVATSSTITLADGTTTPVTTFPYISTVGDTQPLAIFSTASLTDATPKVTLFWTASGSDNLTVYATNSSSSPSDEGPIHFNGPITSLLSSGNVLYVGGEFTTVGGVDCKKFCALNISGGAVDPTLGAVGSLVGNPLSAYGDLGTVGTIQAIAESGDLIIVAGSFESVAKGKGLTILDRSTGIVYPFYVNGVVNDLLVVGTDLYVGGTFDYINYLAQSVSVISGLRVYTNGLIKISLSTLIGFPNSSIDLSFASTTRGLFSGPATINSIDQKSGTIYIGGSFSIGSVSNLTARGLAILNSDGTQDLTWKPIIGGDVYTMSVDGDYLYVGGDFKTFHTASQFYSNPRINDDTTKAYNAICFNASTSISPTLESNWKPNFNGPVTNFAFHDSSFSSYVYCYGRFTKVNNSSAGYAAALQKSYNNVVEATSLIWNVSLESGPVLINQGLSRFANSVIIGGTFIKVNSSDRFYLARVNGIDESLSTASLSSVNWQFGAQVCSPGMSLSMDFTNYISVSSFPGPYGTVNQTTVFADFETFPGYLAGDLVKFFARRNGLSDTFSKPAYVLGWKVDFNG
jgi:hypothetical protein